jgi:hypothetical protein
VTIYNTHEFRRKIKAINTLFWIEIATIFVFFRYQHQLAQWIQALVCLYRKWPACFNFSRLSLEKNNNEYSTCFFSCLNNDRIVMLKWLCANVSKLHLQFINQKMLHNVLIQHKTTLSYKEIICLTADLKLIIIKFNLFLFI